MHPNIITIIGVASYIGIPYIIMPWKKIGTICNFIRRRPSNLTRRFGTVSILSSSVNSIIASA